MVQPVKDIMQLKGVGQKRGEALKRLGIHTDYDLVTYYPRRYVDKSEVVPIIKLAQYLGQRVSIIGTLLTPVTSARTSGGYTLYKARVGDDSGVTTITFFNNRYVKLLLRTGGRYCFYGRVGDSAPFLTSPEFSPLAEGDAPGIQPVYNQTRGMDTRALTRLIQSALTDFKVDEPLDNSILDKYKLLPLKEAIVKIHKPQTMLDIQAARRRLIFDELLYYQLGIHLLRTKSKRQTGVLIPPADGRLLKASGLTPTNAQKRAMGEISNDLNSGQVMNRMLQGDVGSGKTLVAAYAAYSAALCGYQAVVMAPTEVLARQHFSYFDSLFKPLGISCTLLCGSMTAAQKRNTYLKIKEGSAQLVIATHAVIQAGVSFNRLGLVITDEQHRFGVMQRAALSAKGEGVHTLVMSATPIPRTLSLILWGDLDLSVLDELPSGRKPIDTFLVDTSYIARLVQFIKKQIQSGGKCYIVCPLVEDGAEGSELLSTQTIYQRLIKNFDDQTLAVIHGRMSAKQKDSTMLAFTQGDVKVLVSTTVIEVGVNVPQATLMIILNAERFGLSQLHQLRGRVGRSDKKSYCVLVSDSKSDKSLKRMQYFTKTGDGFKLAQKDLELRGPGDLFNKAQHGLPQMKIADMVTDMATLKLCGQCAKEILQTDSLLKKDSHKILLKNVRRLFENEMGDIFN